MRPKMLDLCGCEGGASVGFDRAGYDVYVVDMDKNRLKHNPYPSHCGDALWVLRFLLAGGRISFTHKDGRVEWLGLDDFVLVHVSPPCQGYTRGNAGKETSWPKLIGAFRELLIQTGLPYVIENVADAAWDMIDPIPLCGCMFDLKTVDTDGVTIHLQRRRLFETNWGLQPPRVCEGEGRPRFEHPSQEWVAGAYGGARRDKYEAKYVRKGGYVPPDKAVVKALLGIEHDMTWNGLFECLPPAYTEHIGRQLLTSIVRERCKCHPADDDSGHCINWRRTA